MLDDLKVIHTRDKSDALGVAAKQWQQLEHVFATPRVDYADDSPIYNIVVAGMGGSALSATLLHTWPKVKEPLEIVRDYAIPEYVGADTLFIASSYSGNTEEVLSAIDDAEKQQAKIVVVASGGKLAERAKKKNYPLFLLPKGLQPRMATFYSYTALIQLLDDCDLVPENSLRELHEAADWLAKHCENWLPEVPAKKNQAKQIAQEIMGKSAVVYAGPKLFPAAYKWKISINEDAKQIAWCNQLSEFDHNEILGWTEQPVQKPYCVLELRSKLEHPQIQKRFAAADRLLSGKRPAAHVIDAEGKTILQQMLWAITLGDFVAIYLAFLNGLDPTPVELLEKFKKDIV